MLKPDAELMRDRSGVYEAIPGGNRYDNGKNFHPFQ